LIQGHIEVLRGGRFRPRLADQAVRRARNPEPVGAKRLLEQGKLIVPVEEYRGQLAKLLLELAKTQEELDK
jgi:hypothetical protein